MTYYNGGDLYDIAAENAGEESAGEQDETNNH